MPRKPWFRASDGWWYAEFSADGKTKQVKLARGKKSQAQAARKFNELMALDPATVVAVADLTVAEAFDRFLEWSLRENDPKTYAYYKTYLQSFARLVGPKLRVGKLIPNHVTLWFRDKTWNSTTRNRAVSCVKRALNFCVAEGLLKDHPLRNLKKDRMLRREKVLSLEERRAILDAVPDRAFQQFLFALGQTGARPMEVRAVTAENVRDAVWVLKSKDYDRTGKLRHIYLTPAMVELTRTLCREHPTGPLFRNTRGEPWSVNAVRIRFRNLRERLKLDPRVCAYAFCHTFVTDALEKGVPIATVAELAGHADTKMVSQVYSHLSQKGEHLRQAMIQAVED